MDGDFIVWLFVVAFWLVSGLLNRLGRKFQPNESEMPPEIDPAYAEGVPVEADPRRARANKLERALREMVATVEDLGVPPSGSQPSGGERPVPSEHERTESEHRRTRSEHRQTTSERLRTRSEHRRTILEHLQTDDELLRTASEHRRTASEHQPGDYEAPRTRPLSTPEGSPRHHRHARRLLGLHNRKDLARAIVLQEVLGPPVSMRPTSGNKSV